MPAFGKTPPAHLTSQAAALPMIRAVRQQIRHGDQQPQPLGQNTPRGYTPAAVGNRQALQVSNEINHDAVVQTARDLIQNHLHREPSGGSGILSALSAPTRLAAALGNDVVGAAGTLGDAASTIGSEIGKGAGAAYNEIYHVALPAVDQAAYNLASGRYAQEGADALTSALHLGHVVAPTGLNKTLSDVAGNVAKDAVDFFPQTIPSAATVVGAGVKAAEGNPKPLEAVGKGVLQQFTDPKAMEKHPLLTAMLFRGALEGAARAGAEATGRNIVGERPPEVLYNNLTSAKTPYSPQPLTRFIQKRAEGTPLGESVFRPTLKAKINARVDEESAVAHSLQRGHRAAQMKLHAQDLLRVNPKSVGKFLLQPHQEAGAHELIPNHEIVTLLAQTGAKTAQQALADVKSHLAAIREHARESVPGSVDHHQQMENIAAYERVLSKDGQRFRHDPALALRAAQNYREHTNAEGAPESVMVQRGALTPEAQRNALIVPAARHLYGAAFEKPQPALKASLTRAVKGEQAAKGAMQAFVKRGESVPDVVAKAFADSHARRVAAEEKLAATQPGLVHTPTSAGHALRAGLSVKPGEPFTREQFDRVHAFNGRDTPAFVTHKPVLSNAFFGSLNRFPPAETKLRTGEAFLKGSTDMSHHALLEQRVRGQLWVDRFNSTASKLRKFAVLKNGHGFWSSPDEVRHAMNDPRVRAAHGVPADPRDLEMVPVRIPPMFSPKHYSDAIKEAVAHPNELNDEHLDLQHMAAEAERKDAGPGLYAAIPKVALQRFEEHDLRMGSFDKAVNQMTTLFRKSQLSLSTKHVVGVAQENAIRRLWEGAGVISNQVGKRTLAYLKEHDYATYERLKAATLPGENAGMTLRREIYRSPAEYSAVRRVGSDFFHHIPIVGALPHMFDAYATAFTKFMKRIEIEHGQRALLGKAVQRDFRRVNGSIKSVLLLQKKTLHEFLDGRVTDHTINEYTRAVHRMGGNWDAVSPLVARALTYSPFLLWYLNSVKWLAYIMAHHPVKVGALAGSEAGTEKQRQAAGQGYFGPNPVKSFEQGGVPLGGKVVDQQYYSPVGAVNDPLKTLVDLVLPPLATPIAQGSLGVNFKGDKLKGPHGEVGPGQQAEIVLNSLAETFLPALRIGRTVREKGGSPYDTSTIFSPQVKPGTAKTPLAGLIKAVRPVRLYANQRQKKTTGRSLPGMNPSMSLPSLP